MLISEKMQATDFSNTEQRIVDLMLTQGEMIQEQTIQQLATQAFVHPSIFIRVAHKLDFAGWTALKNAFCNEQRYVQQHFTNVEANLPFTAQDSVMTIAQKMAHLEQTTIADTLSLMHYDQLQQARQLLIRAKHIKIFASNANLLIAEDFVLKMRRINKQVTISKIVGEHVYEAHHCDETACAIIISYTGENRLLCDIAQVLRTRQCPIIALTSLGENTLATQATCTLTLTTRERLYSKIANFTTNTSICYLLDVLYSCVFADQYEEHLAHLIELGKTYDPRVGSNTIMQERE